jgi:hypothetical protein
MGAENLLSRLNGVRSTGRSRWMANCPAHEDRHPSLNIRELDDGRVLAHCFAGCGISEVLQAVGLEFDSLYPQTPIHHSRKERRPFNTEDVFAAVLRETTFVAVIACNLAKGIELTENDRQLLLLAAERLNAAGELSIGKY